MTKIEFQQQPSLAWPLRNKKLTFPFVHNFETDSSWENLTDKCTITLPKNVVLVDANGSRMYLANDNTNIGGFSVNPPVFLSGDSVLVSAGYKYMDNAGNEVAPMNVVFEGYISKVGSKKPFTIECQGNMWKLKQIAAPNKIYPAKSYSLEGILKDMLLGSGFTVNVTTDTSFGDFRVHNETVAEVLARLKKDYHFYSYFRGSELRVGSLVYLEADAIADGLQTFTFQRNIIHDDLQYKRKDDINLSAIAYSINKNEFEVTTKDGATKTKKERLEVLVTERNGTFLRSIKAAGTKADFAPNTIGERRTLFFWNVGDPQTLGDLAENELKRYYYTGLTGKFTTFGLPYVRHGDNVQLMDNVLPERNGIYKVKGVKYSGGVGGLRQQVSLDYRVT